MVLSIKSGCCNNRNNMKSSIKHGFARSKARFKIKDQGDKKHKNQAESCIKNKLIISGYIYKITLKTKIQQGHISSCKEHAYSYYNHNIGTGKCCHSVVACRKAS